MRHPRLARRVNKIAVFPGFRIPPVVDASKVGCQQSIKNEGIAYICSLLTYFVILFIQLRGSASMSPLQISVVMPVYNGEQFVAKAVESILNQTFKEFEFVIIDDKSTDNSVKIIKSFHDSRMKLIQNEKNFGVATSLNKGIQHSKGQYIARMDADDISYPNRLEEQFSFLEKNPGVSVLGTFASLFNENGRIWETHRPPVVPTLRGWLWGSQVIHASVMMKKQDVQLAGGYDPRTYRVEDYDLWLRMIIKGYVIRTLPKVLYAIHWDLSDYNRKNLKRLISETKYKLMRFGDLGVPLYKYPLAFKPILPIFIPKRLYFLFHSYSFKRKSDGFLFL